jgi:hypothetical protein
MKKHIILLLATLCTLSIYPFGSNGFNFNITSSTTPYTVEVTNGYYGTWHDLVIPSNVTYNGISYSVTKIANNAFLNDIYLTSIRIPNSVTRIGNYAFSVCLNLTTIDLPNSITTIDSSAFNGCNGLTSVTIPNSVLSIGSQAFSYCYRLTSISISKSVTFIGSKAFYDNANLTSINVDVDSHYYSSVDGVLFDINKSKLICYPQKNSTATNYIIPATVTSLAECAFYKCKNFTSITIPNSVTDIGYDCFFECRGLTSITIPNSVTNIGNGCFTSCSSLFNITIPNSVTNIGNGCFANCESLSNVTIPNSITKIGESTFNECSGLISVTIPSSVTFIGKHAFNFCCNLTTIRIPYTVTTIEEQAFSQCQSLTSFHSNPSIPPYLPLGMFYGVNKTTCTLYVPTGSKAAYQQADIWSEFLNIEEEITNTQTLSVNDLKIDVYGNKVSISNLTSGITLQVFTTDGKMIFQEKAINQTLDIFLPLNQIYIIKVGDKSAKVIL